MTLSTPLLKPIPINVKEEYRLYVFCHLVQISLPRWLSGLGRPHGRDYGVKGNILPTSKRLHLTLEEFQVRFLIVLL